MTKKAACRTSQLPHTRRTSSAAGSRYSRWPAKHRLFVVLRFELIGKLLTHFSSFGTILNAQYGDFLFALK